MVNMNKINITDIKSFMSKLLIKDNFDNFLLKEATITTFNTFNINGQIKESFYSKEDFMELDSKTFSYWSAIKPICFNLIKGTRLPVSFKIILKANDEKLLKHMKASGCPLSTSDVEGLYLNIKYENNTLDCISSTSLYTFTTDKTLEHYWDSICEKYLLALF